MVHFRVLEEREKKMTHGFSSLFVTWWLLLIMSGMTVSSTIIERMDGNESSGAMMVENPDLSESLADKNDPDGITAKHMRLLVRNLMEANGSLPNQKLVQFGEDPVVFVRYSAYRFDLRSFYIVGVLPREDFYMHRWGGIQNCLWLSAFDLQQADADCCEKESDKFVTGTAETKMNPEHHKKPYGVATVYCKFPRDVGASGKGGHLFLHFTTLPQAEQVQLVLQEGAREPMQFVSTYSRRKKTKTKFSVEFLHCAAPFHNHISGRLVKEWLLYYTSLFKGSVHFLLYDSGGLNAGIKKIIQPFEESGLASLHDFIETNRYEMHYYGQVLALTDCLHYGRYFAKWVTDLDFDEYLYFTLPNTLETILHQYADIPTVSFGWYLFSVNQCLNNTQPDAWRVETMPYRQPIAFCANRRKYRHNEGMCEDTWGHRKWFANPVVVTSPGVHFIEDLAKDVRVKKKKEVIHIKIARFGHFKGILRLPTTCREMHDKSETRIEDKYSQEFVFNDWRLETGLRDGVKYLKARLSPKLLHAGE